MKRYKVMAAALALLAGVAFTACGDDEDETGTTDTSADAAGELVISDVWARTSPMMASRGAVYMVIENGTDSDDALLSASVDASIAATVEVHETVTDMESDATSDSSMGNGDMGNGNMGNGNMGNGDNPMMGMREIDELPIPAGETVALEPGGYHVMLIDLVEPLEEGSTIDVTLEFEEAGEQTVTAEVRTVAP